MASLTPTPKQQFFDANGTDTFDAGSINILYE
jgi:hypothetical protein